MLVLTRKRFEKIRIGEDITIKVIRTGRSAVKIGIEAPEHIRVVRGELCMDQPPGSAAEKQSESQDVKPRMAIPCSQQLPFAV